MNLTGLRWYLSQTVHTTNGYSFTVPLGSSHLISWRGRRLIMHYHTGIIGYETTNEVKAYTHPTGKMMQNLKDCVDQCLVKLPHYYVLELWVTTDRIVWLAQRQTLFHVPLEAHIICPLFLMLVFSQCFSQIPVHLSFVYPILILDILKVEILLLKR